MHRNSVQRGLRTNDIHEHISVRKIVQRMGEGTAYFVKGVLMQLCCQKTSGVMRWCALLHAYIDLFSLVLITIVIDRKLKPLGISVPGFDSRGFGTLGIPSGNE